MPRLLDTRLIGRDIADVTTRSYAGAVPGNVLQVAADGQSMELSSPNIQLTTQLAKEAELERSGISIQQQLCSSWVECGPTGFIDQIFGMAYGAGRFVIVGHNSGPSAIAVGSISTGISNEGPNLQTPGVSWSSINLNLPSLNLGGVLYGIIFVEDKFVCCGANGAIITSLDGYTWTQVRTGGSESLYRVAYGPGVGYVFVGNGGSGQPYDPGIVIYSPDLVTFTTYENPLGSTTSLYGVTWGNGVFVAVGGAGTTSPSIPQQKHIMTSTNGVTWTVRDTNDAKLDNAHYCVEYGMGRFVVGTNNAVGSPNSNLLISRNNGISWELVTSQQAIGNVQTVAYGNGVFVAGDSQLSISNDGISFQRLASPYAAGGTQGINAACAYGNGIFMIASREGRVARSKVAYEIFGVNSGSGGGGGGSGGSSGGSSGGGNTSPINATIPFVPNPGDVGSYTLAVAYDEPNGGIIPAYPGITKEANQLRLAGTQAASVSAGAGGLSPMGTYDSAGNLVAAWTGTWKNMGTACGLGSLYYTGGSTAGGTDSPSEPGPYYYMIVWGLWMRIS